MPDVPERCEVMPRLPMRVLPGPCPGELGKLPTPNQRPRPQAVHKISPWLRWVAEKSAALGGQGQRSPAAAGGGMLTRLAEHGLESLVESDEGDRGRLRRLQRPRIQDEYTIGSSIIFMSK